MTARHASTLAGALTLFGVALGCSALVDPHPREPRCEPGEAGVHQVCPEGLQCIDGRCQRTCVSNAIELCHDGVDNDCDGNIDEADALGRDACGDGIDNDCDDTIDEGSDSDRDGYNRCGDTTNPMTGPDGVDCDDFNSSVHPGLPEVCDGRDNDCDGNTDNETPGQPLCPADQRCLNQRCVQVSCANPETGVTCAPEERCDARTGRCVPRSCAADTCREDQVCDRTTNTCRPRVRQANGSPCESELDCLSNSCIEGVALGFANAERVCGQACCDDSQCGADERCFASGKGARSCLPAAVLSDSGSPECVTDSACASTQVCGLSREDAPAPPQFVPRDAIVTSTCMPKVVAAGIGARCTFPAECTTRVCIPGVVFGNVCSNPCGNSNDCAVLDDVVRRSGGLGAYCRFVDVTLDGAPPDYSSVCVVRRFGETGPGISGAVCVTGRDCLDGGCVGATSTTKGLCTSTCCVDSQCGRRDDGSPIACHPLAFGARYEMRCDI